jgi:4-amino-4-deoxy-L-arabinose transferase-like glycosyltransferase
MIQAKTSLALLAVAVAFLAAAMLFLPRLGIEADEAMLANGIYDHGAPWYSWKFGSYEIPVMLIGYLGALKTWLYNPYFLAVAPGPVSLRLPMVLLSAMTLWLFFVLLDRAAGRTAAWIGTLLLATDSCYLLVTATDFGFVVLQFLFKLAALLLLLKFHDGASRWALAGAFFLLGLALWDKAVFLWVLFGLAVAALVVFPREIRRHASGPNVAIAAVALLLGALPLVIYNIARPLETLRANAKVGGEPTFAKLPVLASTLDGNILFGFVTAAEPGPEPGQPRHWFQSLSLRIAEWTRHPRFNLTLLAFLISLPFVWHKDIRRPMLFALLMCAGTWLAMALSKGAGMSVQHTILLWPFPQWAIAVALSRAPMKLAAAGTAVLCLANIAVTNQYYADLIRNGPAVRWTDSIDALNRYLIDSKPGAIYAADWGFLETLNLISEGDRPMFQIDPADSVMLGRMIAAPGGVFVSHTPPLTFQPDLRAAVEDLARRQGFEEQPLTTISDRNGRPTFDVFRFRKLHL